MFQNWHKTFYELDTGTKSGGGTEPIKAEPTPAEPKPIKTYTQEELNAIIAKEVGKVEKITQSKLKELEEAERLKGMSEAERQAAELKKAREELNQYKNEKLATQFKLELSNKTLPPDFADFIPVADAEKAKAAVDFLAKYKADITSVLQKEIDELKQQLTNANLRGVTPKAVSGGGTTKTELPKTF